MTNQAGSSTKIAFIDIFVFEDGAIRGGVLVTDVETRPYEFRVTSPIKPTQLQKILYGSSLTEYVYGELICQPLLRQVKEKISLAIAKNDNLLVARPGLPFPLVIVQKGQAGNPDNSLNTLIVHAHSGFPGEQAQAEILINTFAQQHDIFEPFERIKLAVAEAHKQNIDKR